VNQGKFFIPDKTRYLHPCRLRWYH